MRRFLFAFLFLAVFASFAFAAECVIDGVVFNEADEAFLSAVRDRLEGLEADWIEQADGLGVDGEAALARMREVVSGVEN